MKYRQKDTDDRRPLKTAQHYKQKKQGRFNFNWDPDLITYRTEVSQIPQKPKSKPDPKVNQRKQTQIKSQIDIYKAERKQKKKLIVEETKSFEQDINQLNYNIDLGQKCLKVLKYDREEYERKLEDLDHKVKRNKREINNLNRDVPKEEKKKMDQMNLDELKREEERLLQRMSTEQLTKKQENDINEVLKKIGRLRVTADKPSQTRGRVDNENNRQIAQLKTQIQRFHNAQNSIKSQLQEVQMKIQSIQSDLQRFKDQKHQIQDERDKDEKVSRLTQENKVLKEKIYKAREELDNLSEDFEKRISEYEYEQEKIKWINWALQVKEKISQEWEQQKARKKKQNQKFKQGAGQKKDKKDKKDKQDAQLEDDTKPKYERPRINHYQNEIDNCSFLINYCKDLYPSVGQNEKKKKGDVNVDEKMKEGEWSKMKGIEVVVPKKKKNLDQKPSANKPKEVHQEKEESEKNKFNHQYFIEQAFQKVKILPPTNVEELEKIINELEEKQKYYLEHPEGGERKRQDEKKGYTEKYAPEKYTKVKTQHNKRVINNEDFPYLQD